MTQRQLDSVPPLAVGAAPALAAPTASMASAPLDWSAPAPAQAAIAIIGGGFSGLLTAIHALQQAPTASAMIVERMPRARPGAAYGGADGAHLLNVRADRMGVTPSAVGAFAAWLEQRFPGAYQPGDFVRRQLFGDFLNESVTAAMAPLRGRLSLVRDGAVSVTRTDTGLTVHLASGAATRVDAVVLALGLPAAAAPWSQPAPGGSVADPWSPAAYEDLDPDAPVVVLGSGLTALDVLGSLSRRGHRGPVTVVSRNGRFPLPHSTPSAGAPIAIAAAEIAGGPRRALRELRRAARAAHAAGRPWQDAVDAVRPHTTPAWRAWNDADRERFLTRLRPFWEIHRHRAPVPVLQIVDRGVATGQLQIVRGTVVAIDGAAPAWTVTIRSADARVTSHPAARVFNCVGPAMRVTDSDDPLLASLRAQGLTSTDAAGLGLRADAQGRALDATGAAQDNLFVLGALRRGDLWESTAVPELRGQAEAVGAAVAATLLAPAAC